MNHRQELHEAYGGSKGHINPTTNQVFMLLGIPKFLPYSFTLINYKGETVL